jgi:hypothetical protein
MLPVHRLRLAQFFVGLAFFYQIRKYKFLNLDNCLAPAPSGLRPFPYDKSSTDALALSVFPLSQSKCSSPYAAKRALALFLFGRLVGLIWEIEDRMMPVERKKGGQR